MPTTEKQNKINSFAESLKKAQIAFVAEYHGLTVAEVSKLRRLLREQASEMIVIKNTLAKQAFKEVGYENFSSEMVGPLAFFLGYETVVHAPKVAFDFAKGNEKLKIKSGYYAGKIVPISILKELADLPPMPQLRIKFARTIASPPRQFLMTVMSPTQRFAMTLNALAKKREEAAA